MALPPSKKEEASGSSHPNLADDLFTITANYS
jgi:hypothetical protein